MNKISEITNLRLKMYGKKTPNTVLKERKHRLQKLIDCHGHDAVAAAAGLSVSSVVTYMRTKYPRLSENTLVQAEEILTQIQ